MIHAIYGLACGPDRRKEFILGKNVLLIDNLSAMMEERVHKTLPLLLLDEEWLSISAVCFVKEKKGGKKSGRFSTAACDWLFHVSSKQH